MVKIIIFAAVFLFVIRKINMSAKKFHDSEFDTGTLIKLDLFRKYFRESFPVFLYSPFFEKILIFDFFAGQGKNDVGQSGTSIIFFEELKYFCKDIVKMNKKITLILNDLNTDVELRNNIQLFLSDCSKQCSINCPFIINENVKITKNDFTEYFNRIYSGLKNSKTIAKLLYIDPFNFVIDDVLFKKIIDIPHADFLCFMPSLYLKRFPDNQTFKKYIDINKINIKTSPGKIHQSVVDYYDSLIPENKEYYIGGFSIKKRTSYYGIILGSNHSLGAEKIQKVCWEMDPTIGEACYNIDNETSYNNQLSIFEEDNVPLKIRNFQKDLKRLIVNQTIKTDKEAYKYALKKRCNVSHAVYVLKELMECNFIENFKTKNNSIHRIKIPTKIIINGKDKN